MLTLISSTVGLLEKYLFIREVRKQRIEKGLEIVKKKFEKGRQSKKATQRS